MTAGPWRPIVFKEFTTILSSVQTKALVTADNEIRLSLNIDLAGSISSDLSLGIRLLDQNGECLRDEVHPLSLKGICNVLINILRYSLLVRVSLRQCGVLGLPSRISQTMVASRIW